MTPFERLILFAGGALSGGAIAAAAVLVSPWIAAGAITGAVVIASVATLERAPAEPESTTAEARGLRPVARQETERRARAARDE